MLDEQSWDRLTEMVRSTDLNAIIINSYQAVSHFAGTQILSQLFLPDRLAYLVVARAGESLVVCSIEAGQVRGQTAIETIVGYQEFVDTPEQVVASELRRLGVTSGPVGTEARRMSAQSRDQLMSALPDLVLRGVDDEIEILQTIKLPSVCDDLATAARITQSAIEETAQSTQPGASEREFSSKIVGTLARDGGTPVFCFFGSGPRALQGHPESTSAVLERGAIWRVDVGGRFGRGLMSDVARTGVVGEPTPDQVRAFTTIKDAQRAGFEQLRPGLRAADVYHAVQKRILAAGYKWTIPHVGHGLGVGIHEEPILAPNNQTRLEPGMVVNIEPILLLPERGEAYHTEDLAVICDDGCRLLTTPQAELLRVGE